MNLNLTRLVKLIAGLILIIIGGGLFVLFTGSINVAEKMGGPPMAGVFSMYFWCIIVLVFDLVSLGLILGGVKLAGFSWSVFGWIIIVVGLGVLCLGIWNHLNGPPVDYDSTRSDDRMPVPPAVNSIVYIWAGLTMLAGLLLAALTSREVARKKEH